LRFFEAVKKPIRRIRPDFSGDLKCIQIPQTSFVGIQTLSFWQPNLRIFILGFFTASKNAKVGHPPGSCQRSAVSFQREQWGGHSCPPKAPPSRRGFFLALLAQGQPLSACPAERSSAAWCGAGALVREFPVFRYPQFPGLAKAARPGAPGYQPSAFS